MSNDKCVLIVSNMDYDLHAVVIRSELEKRGQKVLCTDPVNVVAKRNAIGIPAAADDWFQVDDVAVQAAEIKSVLYRRPTPLESNAQIDREYVDIVNTEWQSLITGWWSASLEDALWVSRPAAIKQAENKIQQLHLAKQLGFKLPETLVTNDHAALQQFTEQHGLPVLGKKLKTHCIITEQRGALFASTLFDDLDAIDQDALALCPIIFQTPIEKAYESRVVVIGDEIYAVSMDTQAFPESQVDYRVLGENMSKLKHEDYVLPEAEAQRCRAMLRYYGLQFGAFDFIITPQGEHVFLELNPNGQWLWLQLATQVKLTDAFCRLLMRGRQKRSANSALSRVA